MTVTSAWQGAATSTSIRVRAQVTGSSTRLLVADNQGLTGAAGFGPVVPTADGIATLDATGLDPSTSYWWAVEDDSVVDEVFRGRFRTHPPLGEPASFAFAAATCAQGVDFPGVGAVLAADRVSNHPVFSTIRTHQHDPLFFFHGGDLHYYDLGSGDHGITGGGSLANYLRAYEDVLLQPRQHQLYREVPLVLSCGGGGHDWGQPVGLGGTLPARNEVLRAYRERVPHYPTADPATTAGTYHSFQVGRVLFLVTDENADRNPDADPEGPNKTKLGASQKSWLIGQLTSSQAEILVWLSGAQWHRGGAANWGGYTTERAELIQILGDLGWLDRMVFITGDRHALEIVRAGDNPLGGFPIWHYASLDSSADPTATPGSPGTNRYGTVQVVDDGDQITLTGTGWIGTGVWDSDTLTVQLGEETPPPGPGPAPVAEAAIQRRVTWLGVHAVTGRIIAELPDVRGSVGRLLSAYSSHQLTMPLPRSGPGHIPIELVEQATEEITAAIVAVVNDIPVWMGWVLTRRGGTGSELRIGTATPEAYLRRRRVRDRAFTDVDRADVAAALIEDAGDLVGVGGGLGFVLAVEPTGELISPTYLATDRLPVYGAVRELAAGGIEFTVDLDWTDSTHTVVHKILRVGPRIGKAAAPGTAALFETTASSVFESQAGSEATYELTEDATTGRYANHVVATAPGEGEDQPASAAAIDQAALDGGAPIVEHILELSSVTDQNALDVAAQAELARLRRGAEVWDISARLDTYPRLGVDAQLGDDVAWLLTGHRHPTGVLGQGRMIGYEVDEQAGRWRPVLLDPQGTVI